MYPFLRDRSRLTQMERLTQVVKLISEESPPASAAERAVLSVMRADCVRELGLAWLRRPNRRNLASAIGAFTISALAMGEQVWNLSAGHASATMVTAGVLTALAGLATGGKFVALYRKQAKDIRHAVDDLFRREARAGEKPPATVGIDDEASPAQSDRVEERWSWATSYRSEVIVLRARRGDAAAFWSTVATLVPVISLAPLWAAGVACDRSHRGSVLVARASRRRGRRRA